MTRKPHQVKVYLQQKEMEAIERDERFTFLSKRFVSGNTWQIWTAPSLANYIETLLAEKSRRLSRINHRMLQIVEGANGFYIYWYRQRFGDTFDSSNYDVRGMGDMVDFAGADQDEEDAPAYLSTEWFLALRQDLQANYNQYLDAYFRKED